MRRSLPAPAAGPRGTSPLLLALTGLAIFVDIEFVLAYLLYFALRAAS